MTTTKAVPMVALYEALDRLEAEAHRPEMFGVAMLATQAILDEIKGAEDLFPVVYQRAVAIRRAVKGGAL